LSLHIGKNPSRSVNYYSKVLVIILIAIVLINIIVTFFTISITRQQSIDYITNTVTLYLQDTEQKLNAIDHFMIWSVKNEPLIKNIENAKDMSELPKAISNFRTRVNDFQYSTGKEYQFFLALNKENYFFNTSSLQLNYSEYLVIKDYFLTQKPNTTKYEEFNTWQSLKVHDRYHLYHLLEYENRTLISLIAVENLLSPLNDINLGNDGTLIMTDGNDNFIAGSKQDLEKVKASSFFNSYLVFHKEDSGLPFSLHVSVDHFSAFKKVVIAQFALIFATIVISLFLFFILSYIKNRVLSPIQLFSKNLAEMNKNNETIDFESSSIIELEEANEQVRGLITEIKNLKINYYEQEFEKKQIQMDFMKLQIKPHFYLNCLTTIYSMAQMEMYKEIKEMAISTSNYFRYLFQTNQNFVKITKELEHVKDYLAIQKLLHAHSFLFEVQVEDGIQQAKIPPLVIQTFIENTVKHAVSLDEQISISLQIQSKQYKNNKVIWITLCDNGPGFPTDILAKLQNKLSLTTSSGHHIGINNVLQRLTLLYGDDFHIEFSNRPDGGAMIQIAIPYLIYEESE